MKTTKISLKRIHYALMTNEQTETWGEVKTLTMPISMTLTPNFSEAHLDAGDRVVDQEAQLILSRLLVKQLIYQQKC